MSSFPDILKNPYNALFNLNEYEIYLLKEVDGLMEMGKYPYCIFTLWNLVVVNMQRRIEKFGIYNLLNILENKEEYIKEGSSLKDRWININEYKLIDYALELNLINHVAHDLIRTLYWMKTEQEEVSENEIFAILSLLEKNLFLKKFKVDRRLHKEEVDRREFNRGGRRKSDNEKLISSLEKISTTPSTTHQELLLKSGVKQFQHNLDTNNKNGAKLLNTYI